MSISIGYYLILGALLFAIGLFGILINRKNMIKVLMSIELLLLAVNINFVSFAQYFKIIEGGVFVFFILAVAAAEAAIGLALLVLFYKNIKKISLDSLTSLKG